PDFFEKRFWHRSSTVSRDPGAPVSGYVRLSLFSSLSKHYSMIVIGMHRFKAFGLRDDQFIQGVQIGLGAGNNDVGVRAMPTKDTRVGNLALGIHRLQSVLSLDAHRDLTHGVDPFRDRMD